MADLSLEDKCKAAAQLVQQSPPGEVKSVLFALDPNSAADRFSDVINGARWIVCPLCVRSTDV
jgi:hypothetical protein